MTRPSEHLMDWLRDAHSMEKNAIDMLEKQEKRLESYPEMRARVRAHRAESEQQAELVERLIESLGGKTSALKNAAAKFMGNMGAIASSAASDEVVKNGIADYAFEHFEIASYRALIAAAEAENQPEVVRVCREILAQEEDMARWLEENLPQVTQHYLERDFAGAHSKR